MPRRLRGRCRRFAGNDLGYAVVFVRVLQRYLCKQNTELV